MAQVCLALVALRALNTGLLKLRTVEPLLHGMADSGSISDRAVLAAVTSTSSMPASLSVVFQWQLVNRLAPSGCPAALSSVLRGCGRRSAAFVCTVLRQLPEVAGLISADQLLQLQTAGQSHEWPTTSWSTAGDGGVQEPTSGVQEPTSGVQEPTSGVQPMSLRLLKLTDNEKLSLREALLGRSDVQQQQHLVRAIG